MNLTVFSCLLLALFASVKSGLVKRQSLLSDVSTNVNCPSGWDPSPCVCKDGPGSDKSSVFCNNATSGEDIKTAFGKLENNHQFVNFVMNDASVTSLPANVFGKGSFQMFFISNSKLGSLDDATFQGCEETAENFLLENNNFQDFNFKALQPLNKLTNFECSEDKIEAVPDDAFGEKPLLEVVNLNGNKIATLGKNAFSKLPKLKKIDFSNNKLTSINEDALNLSPDVSPISLLLSHNEISTISENAFKNVKLRLFELEDNKLEALDEKIFSPLIDSLKENHGTLSTLGNPFNCDEASTKWLVDLPAEKRSSVIGFICKNGLALQQLEFS